MTLMAFANQLSLSPDAPTAVATNVQLYDLTSFMGPSSERKVAGLDLDCPKTLSISHEKVKNTGVKRHKVQTSVVVQDGTDPNIVGTIMVYTIFVVPPLVSTAALVKAEAYKLMNLLSVSGNIEKILNEEI